MSIIAAAIFTEVDLGSAYFICASALIVSVIATVLAALHKKRYLVWRILYHLGWRTVWRYHAYWCCLLCIQAHERIGNAVTDGALRCVHIGYFDMCRIYAAVWAVQRALQLASRHMVVLPARHRVSVVWCRQWAGLPLSS